MGLWPVDLRAPLSAAKRRVRAPSSLGTRSCKESETGFVGVFDLFFELT